MLGSAAAEPEPGTAAVDAPHGPMLAFSGTVPVGRGVDARTGRCWRSQASSVQFPSVQFPTESESCLSDPDLFLFQSAPTFPVPSESESGLIEYHLTLILI